MLEFLPEKPGIVAMKLTGRLHYEDIEKAYDRMEFALAASSDVHVFVEIADFEGFDLDILVKNLSVERTLLDRLDHFGRIAVVSDKRWIRALARIESALLAKVTYRIFTEEQRDAALAWVEGEEDLPYGHVLRIIETDSEDVLGIEVDGHMGREELDHLAREINIMRKVRAPAAVLVRYKSYDGFDPSAISNSEFMKMKFGMMGEIRKYALVGGPDWMRSLVKMADPLFKGDFRSFDFDDEEEAWDWLGAEPVTDRSLIMS